jgi:predicted transcriptional regulator of viral defense system
VRATGTTQSLASRALSRLARQHLLTRVKQGVWSDTKNSRFSPYAVVPYLVGRDVRSRDCYVSFVSALNLHGMISQIPGAIHVAVARQRRTLNTPVARYAFHKIDQALMGGFADGDRHGRFQLATPAKALFDTLYISLRKGRSFSRLPEIDLPRSVTDAEMQRWIGRIAFPMLRAAVNARWQELRRMRV